MSTKTKKSGIVVLGYFIWWSIQGVKILRAKLDELVQKSGLDISTPPTLPRTAFLEAVRAVKSRAHSNKVLIRNLKKSKDEHIFGLVDEQVDDQHLKLGYSHRANLRFDQHTGEISVNTPHRAFDLILEKYNENQLFVNSYELRRWLMKILLKLSMISVREKGGVYFVDVKHEENLLKLITFLSEFEGCELVIIPQVDDEKTKKAIMKAFVADLKHKVEIFREQIADEKFTSQKGWERKLKQFKELREEVSFYAERLEFNGKDLEADLKDLERKVRAKLTEE